MKKTVQAKEVKKVSSDSYRIIRKYAGKATGETVILNLIKAHMSNT